MDLGDRHPKINLRRTLWWSLFTLNMFLLSFLTISVHSLFLFTGICDIFSGAVIKQSTTGMGSAMIQQHNKKLYGPWGMASAMYFGGGWFRMK